MTILDVLDKVERGDYRDDRYPLVIEDVLPVEPFRISHTYTLEDALQHAQIVFRLEDALGGQS